MTDGNALVETFRAACDADETIRARFDADPRGVLAEYGFEIPEGAKCEFVGGDDLVHFTLPKGALTDAQLAKVSGGVNVASTAAIIRFITLPGISALVTPATRASSGS